MKHPVRGRVDAVAPRSRNSAETKNQTVAKRRIIKRNKSSIVK